MTRKKESWYSVVIRASASRFSRRRGCLKVRSRYSRDQVARRGLWPLWLSWPRTRKAVTSSSTPNAMA
jgi:hypothetical protein